MLKRAIQIARIAHQGQTDKGGHDYISHPIRVMNSLESEVEKIVGVLHDTIEDSQLTFNDLRDEGFSENVIEAINAITKRKRESYDDYLKRVMSNPIATKVKIADLKDNSDLSRIPQPTEKDYRRTEKYKQAIKFLSELG